MTTSAAGAPPPELLDLAAAGDLALRLEGRRLDVVLDAPQRRNAQTPATWRALAAVGAWARDAADVVVVRGSGASFSAGLDRRAFTPEGIDGEPGLHQLAALPPAELDATIAAFQAGFAVWGQGPFVSVAAVQGHAVGAGFQLALACDVRLAADDARFAMREPALGLVPDLGGTAPLVAAVGFARAVEICATARWVDAPEAAALGLVQAVVPAGELPAAVDAFADAVLANPSAAVRATRALLAAAAHRDRPEQLAAERSAQGDQLRALAGEAPRR
ncbi:MAG TPA: enoyl-CoA hydratase/isomerase family protein [Kineosporiaceae bacterium]|nr:enoyl-CoA hydratase/isomerase family protein [Kineosporiaceae bacterium]